ncbi:PQQ-binding-like beta-propeller repeat protein [Deltaproteobacteria bacterium TL4]
MYQCWISKRLFLLKIRVSYGWVLSFVKNLVTGIKAFDCKNSVKPRFLRLIIGTLLIAILSGCTTSAIKWKLKTKASLRGPMVVDKDYIYFGDKDGFLYKIDMRSGKLEWTKQLQEKILENINIVDGKIIFKGSDFSKKGSRIYEIEGNGNVLWEHKIIEDFSGPISISNNLITFTSGNSIHTIDLINRKETKWKFDNNFRTYTIPAISKGSLFFHENYQSIYAINKMNGKIEWEFDPDQNGGGLIQLADNTLYYLLTTPTHSETKLYAIDPHNGQKKWEFKFGGNFVDSIVIDNKGIYFGTTHNYLYGLKLDGTEKWKFKGESVMECPAIGDNKIYVGSGYEKLYALDRESGQLLWKMPIEVVTSDCPFVHQDTLFFNGSTKAGSFIYAIDLIKAEQTAQKP